MQFRLIFRCTRVTNLQACSFSTLARLRGNAQPNSLVKFLSTMPPKRTSSKRKVESDNESDREEGPSQSSKSYKKVRKGNGPAAKSTQPTNKVLPVNIVIPPKPPGTTRIVAWNVSGFAASSKKVTRLYFGYLNSLSLPGLQPLCGGRKRGCSHHNRDEGVSQSPSRLMFIEQPLFIMTSNSSIKRQVSQL
jgi:hypothetical protein